MLRGLAIVVSALAALAAQAQEAVSEQPASGASGAADQVNAKRPVMLASRAAPSTTSDHAAVSIGNGADAGTKPQEGAPAKVAASDCSVVETYLAGGTLAVRTYEAPPDSRTSGWKRAPYVTSVTRCGRLYILQVMSVSQDTWVIRQARLEGPGGVVLPVEALHLGTGPAQRTVNVIVARASAGKKLLRLKLDLTGEDGRVAQAEVGDLP